MLRCLSLIRSSSATKPTRRVWLFMVIGMVALFAALFLKLADSVRESEFVVRIDQHTLNFVLDHRVAWISRVARVVTLLGSAWVVTAVTMGTATTFLVLRRCYVDALVVAVSSIGTAILVATANLVIGRPRPAGSSRSSAFGCSFLGLPRTSRLSLGPWERPTASDTVGGPQAR